MNHLTFSNGDQMPLLGLGTWKSSKGEVYSAVRTALQIGYRHFDCAAIYGNEKEIGDAIHDSMTQGEVKREELWITSKLWNTSHQKGQVKPALEKTLERLDLKFLDLYLMHWPIAMQEDAPFPFTSDAFIPLEKIPLEETWKAMLECKEAGLTRHVGVANFSINKIASLIDNTGSKPEVNQIEIHPFLQHPMVGYCKKEGIYLTAYSPLGSRDKPGNADDTPDLFTNNTIAQIAKKNNCSPAQILIKWAVERGISVIPKSVNPDRLQQNFDSLNVHLTAEDIKQIASLDKHYRFIDGSFFTPKGSPYTLANLWDES